MSKQIENKWQRTMPADWKVKHVNENGEEQEIALRDHPCLASYTSKDEAVKALVHAQRLLGKTPEGYVRLPGDGAEPDEMSAFYTALGRPEGADGYELPEFDLPEGYELQEAMLEGFRTKSHELGLTPKQVAGLYSWFLPIVMDKHHELESQAQQLRDSELDSLRSVHRGDMPSVLDNALRAAEVIGGDELVRALESTGAGDHAAVISAFAKIAPMVLESGLRGSTRGWGEDLSREKLEEMMLDPRYSDPYKRDDAYIRKIREGFKLLYPGKHESGRPA